MRGQRTIRRVLASFCVLAASLALADEPQDEKTRAALSLEHGGKEVTAFTIRSTGGSGALFRLVKKPILRWSNPIRGSVFGDVYIWISKGRPEVVGSFLEWFEPIQSKEVELHSLSLEALKADRPDHLSWTTKRPGVELKPIPGAPQPAATPEKRLRQLRDLAKEFTARQIAHDGVEYEMRLLSQPLYRYENTEGDLIDGAPYVFVHAGDPETFFLIEVRKHGGASQWEYALARFNSVFLAVRHKGREIWKAEQIVPWTNVLDRTEPYTAIMLGKQ